MVALHCINELWCSDECLQRFFPLQRIGDSHMHRGTCHDACQLVTSFEVGGGKNVAGIPGASTTPSCTYLSRCLCTTRNFAHTLQSQHNRKTQPPDTIYTAGKKYGIFFITANFCILWSVKGVSVTEIHSYEPILLLGGVNFHLTAKWSAQVQKQLFQYFSQLDFA